MKPPAPMRKRLLQTLKSLALDTVAAEIAEAAVVLPLLFMVLLGIYWFGQAFRIYGTITRAAQDGARAAAAPACTTCTRLTTTELSTNADNAIKNVLAAANLNSSALKRPTTPPSFLSCLPSGGTISKCDGTSPSGVCVQYDIQLSNTTTGTGVCGVSVTFLYPFTFWLPFTSLNLQKIRIPAEAQVRQENQ
jgi:Flp pilus assembly protein TadG